ncbi:septum site-determining protein MinC [Amaricoccus solimangrovi]|uniref:septum site-determining protein MinC n=1 Tax=Amaricoccus solimangrovi TaxID=2589815 RepID=UPI001F15A8AA|nr:septum site-determining protein MinC [Amaricoccus solimangrovi]
MNPEVDGSPVSVADRPLQVRGRSFTAVVLKLNGAADAGFYGALESLMRQAPHFFVNAPLVIDLAEAPGLTEKADFVKLVRDMRARRLSVIGVQNGTADQDIAAFGAGLVCLQGGRDAQVPRGGQPSKAEDAAEETRGPKARAPEPAQPEPEAASATIVVTEPVRSGQRIFADRGDLIVMAPVSSGAELIAHGNIHVYGPLRGRALAGVNGDKTARIFVQSLEAELVAIAGLYQTSDDLDPSVRRGRVQAFLRDDTLCFEPLK